MFRNWIAEDGNPGQIFIRGLLLLFQHEQIPINSMVDSSVISRGKVFEILNHVRNNLTQQFESLTEKIHTLLDSHFSLSYSRIVFNGIKVLQSGETPASPGEDLIESYVTELDSALCQTGCKEDNKLKNFVGNDTFRKCLKIILHGMNRILSEDWQPQEDTIEYYIQQIIEELSSPDTGLQSCICVLMTIFVLLPNRDVGIERLVNAGVVPRLIPLIGTNDVSLLRPGLLLLASLLSGNTDHTNVVLQADFVSRLSFILKHTDDSYVMLGAILAIGNIAAEKDNIHALLANSDILSEIIKHLEDTNEDVKMDAGRVISNIVTQGTTEQIVFLCQQNILRSYCDLLTLNDCETSFSVLDALWKILLAARELYQEDRMVYMIEECDGWEKVMSLQNHGCKHVQKQWGKFINAFHQHDWIVRWVFP